MATGIRFYSNVVVVASKVVYSILVFQRGKRTTAQRVLIDEIYYKFLTSKKKYFLLLVLTALRRRTDTIQPFSELLSTLLLSLEVSCTHDRCMAILIGFLHFLAGTSTTTTARPSTSSR